MNNLINLNQRRKMKQSEQTRQSVPDDSDYRRKLERVNSEMEYRTEKLAERVLELEEEMTELRRKLNSVIIFLAKDLV